LHGSYSSVADERSRRPIRRCRLLRSQSGVKRTCLFALHMSANDPKRTSLGLLLDPFLSTSESCYDLLSEPRGRQCASAIKQAAKQSECDAARRRRALAPPSVI